MACALTMKLVLTAVLLGEPALKVEDNRTQATDCDSKATEKIAVNENANAVAILKDETGKKISEQKIYVGAFDYYLNENQKGATPAKQTTFFYSYLATPKNLKAKSIELRMLNGAYAQSTSLTQMINLRLR